MFRLLSIFVGLVGLSVPALAEMHEYKLDPVHTQVIFFVDHLGFAKSEGEFLDFDGTIKIDTENLENSSVEVVVKTESIDMDNTKWDDHMKNADFFNVTEFPVMTFKSTKVELTSETTADIHGELSILGLSKPLVLKTVHNKTGMNPFSGKQEIGFSATGVVDRSDYGMTYGLPNVGGQAELRIEVEAIRVGELNE